MIKSIIVSSQTKLTVSIHNIIVSNCNYIFEPENAYFAIYAYVVDANIKVILIKNDFNSIMKISRNFRLENLMKMNYFNACLIDFSPVKLALRRFKFDHKSTWLNKILLVCVAVDIKTSTFATYNFSDILLFNEVTIHNLINSAVEVLSRLIQKYFSLWTNQDFVDFSKKIEWKYL